MAITLAFDVYGTIIDTHGVTVALERHVGERSGEFSRLWREKQLEYSFRRGLMQNYRDFSICTVHALDFACRYYHVSLSEQEKEELMNAYRVLPPFQDVRVGLEEAKDAGFRLFAFSNGKADAVETLLVNSNIRSFFIDVVSVDEIQTFKPNPAVYRHFLKRSGSMGNRAWLISSNPFDVIGAVSAGMRAVWVQRNSDAIFDPWEIEPTIAVKSLAGMAKRIKNKATQPD
ncbi:MAG: haloacid dehalogenase type II [Nitrospiraceae bacterium]|nr:MAG: haloacid dehalogenase type II [Nitrospiraceae bacterium]